jgi:hypothetical protein
MNNIFPTEQLLERHIEYNIETRLLFVVNVKLCFSVLQKNMGNSVQKTISDKLNENSSKCVAK